MSKDKEVLKDEKELEVVETTEEVTEESKEAKSEESKEEAEEAKSEESKEEAEEAKLEESEEKVEEGKSEESEEEESEEEAEEDKSEESEEEAEEGKSEESEEEAEEGKSEESEEEAEEVKSEEESDETEEVVELTEEELAAIAINKKVKQNTIKVLLGVAVAAVAVAVGGYVYTGYRTDFTMPEYVGLELEDIEAIEVTDEYFESELEWIVQYSNPSVEVDRAAKDGDIVDIDYAGSIDGEYFDGGTSEAFELQLGSGTFIDDFEDQLVGSKAGDSVDVYATFPEEYHSAELAGNEALFEVTVNAVKEKIANELTDEYVKAVSEESTTVAEYKEEVRAMLEEQSAESRLYSLKSAAWTLLVDNIQVTVYPKFTIDKLGEEIYAVIEAQAADYEMTLSDYVASAGYNDESFAEYVVEVAQEQYKIKTTVNTIVENEGLELSNEEMDEKVADILEMMGFPDVDTAIENGYTMEDIELNVLVEVVLDYIVEVAEFVEPAALEELNLEELNLEELGLDDLEIEEVEAE